GGAASRGCAGRAPAAARAAGHRATGDRDARILGGAPLPPANRDAAPGDRPDGERLAALSGAGLPAVGALGLLSIRRRIRIPRSAPGRTGVPPRGSGARAGADPAPRRPPVRRRRRAALVA